LKFITDIFSKEFQKLLRMRLKIHIFGISPFKTSKIPESPPHILAVFDMVKKNHEIVWYGMVFHSKIWYGGVEDG